MTSSGQSYGCCEVSVLTEHPEGGAPISGFYLDGALFSRNLCPCDAPPSHPKC